MTMTIDGYDPNNRRKIGPPQFTPLLPLERGGVWVVLRYGLAHTVFLSAEDAVNSHGGDVDATFKFVKYGEVI